MPFTAATAAYLLASALVLATPRPLPWGVGLWFLLMATGATAPEMDLGWLTRGLASPLPVLGAWDGLGTVLTLPSGNRVRAWLALPTASIWASASAIWITVGLAGVLGAVARHRDH